MRRSTATTKGDLVQTYFDTGAMGAQLIYGRVLAAGPLIYLVEWESGYRNRIRQGTSGIRLTDDPETARHALRKLNS